MGTNHQPLFQEETLPRCSVLFACCPTPRLLLKLGHVWTISLILCMLSVLSSIGMLEKVWKKESSLKPVKIWLLLRKIMKKSALTPSKLKEKKAKNTKQFFTHSLNGFSLIGSTIVCKTILTCLCIFEQKILFFIWQTILYLAFNK